MLSGGEDMPESRGFQKLPELIDFFDVLPGDGLDGYGFVVVGLDEPLGLSIWMALLIGLRLMPSSFVSMASVSGMPGG